ncbi:MAG TPA: VCBS repeat-containing protein, partial [Planctomycetota bacterium]|nr:VCBS repeat-containing protein [Planctomycetota bacterium]
GRDLGSAALAGLRARPFPTLDAGAGGNEHVFLWDAVADGVSGIAPTTVEVRVTPLGAGGERGQGAVSAFRMGVAGGLFGPAIAHPELGSTDRAVLADVDQDGRLDLVAIVQNPVDFVDDVAIFPGDGAGGFGAPVHLPNPDREAIRFALGDLDGDGRLDLVVAQSSDVGDPDACSVRLGAGGFAFGPETLISVGFAGPVALADLDGDGALDIVSVEGFVVATALGNGDGTFRDAVVQEDVVDSSNDAAVADMDGDGLPDLVVVATGSGFSAPGTVAVCPGRGDGTFERPARLAAAGPHPVALAIGDVDGDGRLDVVTANDGAADVSVLLGAGGGALGPEMRVGAGSRPRGVALVDLDGDGRLDLAVANHTSSDLSVRLGMGGGAFGPEVRLLGNFGRDAVAAGDLDGDGLPDLLVGPVATVYPTRGRSALAPGRVTAIAASGGDPSLVAGDLDGAGATAVIMTSGDLDVATVLLETDAGLAPAAVVDLGGEATTLALGDLSGAGRLDLVASSGDEDTLAVLRRGPAGAFAAPDVYDQAEGPFGLALADL